MNKIEILEDECCEMRKVLVDGVVVLEGNYWDFTFADGIGFMPDTVEVIYGKYKSDEDECMCDEIEADNE